MIRSTTLIIVTLLFCVAPGCSDGNPTTHPVQGIVRFPDGKTLTRGTVEFELMGQDKPITATGEIESDGTFKLGTFKPDDGAIAGRHRAVVIADHEIGTGVERPEKLPQSVLHSRYREFKTSGLEFTVEPKSNDITVEVDYAVATGI